MCLHLFAFSETGKYIKFAAQPEIPIKWNDTNPMERPMGPPKLSDVLTIAENHQIPIFVLFDAMIFF